MCKCPYCNQKAISYREKLNLFSDGFFAPSGTAICKYCNKIITVSKWAGFFNTTILITAIFPQILLPNFYFRRIVLTFALSCHIIYLVFYSLFVPLIKFDK